jgi:hypothetical protein
VLRFPAVLFVQMRKPATTRFLLLLTWFAIQGLFSGVFLIRNWTLWRGGFWKWGLFGDFPEVCLSLGGINLKKMDF